MFSNGIIFLSNNEHQQTPQSNMAVKVFKMIESMKLSEVTSPGSHPQHRFSHGIYK